MLLDDTKMLSDEMKMPRTYVLSGSTLSERMLSNWFMLSDNKISEKIPFCRRTVLCCRKITRCRTTFLATLSDIVIG
jgi:hypothetical protein